MARNRAGAGAGAKKMGGAGVKPGAPPTLSAGKGIGAAPPGGGGMGRPALPPKPPMTPAVGAAGPSPGGAPPAPGGVGGAGGFKKGGSIGIKDEPPPMRGERGGEDEGPKGFAKGGSVSSSAGSGESQFGPVGKPRGESWPGGEDSKARVRHSGKAS